MLLILFPSVWQIHSAMNVSRSLFFVKIWKNLQIQRQPCLIWHFQLLLNLTFSLPTGRPEIPYSKSHEDFHFLSCSCETVRPYPRCGLKFRCMVVHSRELQAPGPNPIVEDHALTALDGSIQCSPTYPPYLEVATFTRNLWTRHQCFL